VTRVLSAAVLLLVLAGTLWWLPWWATVAMAALIAAVAAAEVAAMTGRAGAPVPPAFAGLGAAMVAIAFAIHGGGPAVPDTDALPAVLLALVIGAGLLALGAGTPAPHVITIAAVVVMAPLYVGLPLGAAAWIRTVLGPAALTWLVVIIVASDSAQYYSGRALGRRKLAPLVSPAKTVEGAVGGLIAGAAAGALLVEWGLPGLGVVPGALMGAALAAVGIMGDLFESMLKRSAGVKDSSQLIPGHGGLLDRIDSYLFAAPFLYLFLRYVP
jgi:phosphatidate cytidylyltransferase